MLTVSAFQARTNLAQLLNRVAKGESIIITRRGVRPTIIKDFRQCNRLNGLSVHELAEEGRRF
jgi:hypothetical protein